MNKLSCTVALALGLIVATGSELGWAQTIGPGWTKVNYSAGTTGGGILQVVGHPNVVVDLDFSSVRHVVGRQDLQPYFMVVDTAHDHQFSRKDVAMGKDEILVRKASATEAGDIRRDWYWLTGGQGDLWNGAKLRSTATIYILATPKFLKTISRDGVISDDVATRFGLMLARSWPQSGPVPAKSVVLHTLRQDGYADMRWQKVGDPLYPRQWNIYPTGGKGVVEQVRWKAF